MNYSVETNDRVQTKFKSLWQLVGNTPMLELKYLYKGKEGRVFCKM